jgi:hypothetical protein
MCGETRHHSRVFLVWESAFDAMRDVAYSLNMLEAMPEHAVPGESLFSFGLVHESRACAALGTSEQGQGLCPAPRGGGACRCGPNYWWAVAGLDRNAGHLFVVGHVSTHRRRWKVALARLSWGLIRGAHPTFPEFFEMRILCGISTLVHPLKFPAIAPPD